jgi:uncharacterized membrane protein
MPKAIRMIRGLGITAIIVIYAMLVHHVNSLGQASVLGATLALVPIFVLVITYAWKVKSRVASICSLLVLFATAWLAWPLIKQHTGLVFWMLDIGLMLMLAMTFGLTLLPGRKPLCVHFAEIINGGTLPTAHEIYARNVTIAWVIFFIGIAIASTLLFFLASLTVWSFFVNFLTLPLVALMFLGEFMLRRRLLTDLPTGHVLDAVHAYLDKSAHER